MADTPKSTNPENSVSESTSSSRSGKNTPDSAEKTPGENTSSQAIVTDYIDPTERRLGPHKNAVNAPLSSDKYADPVHFQLRKLVGLTIATGKHNPKFSAEFLQEVTNLTVQFMGHFVDNLHKLTEVQRHHKPGIADLEMCLSAQHVTPSELYIEYLRTRRLDSHTKAHAAKISTDLEGLLREYHAGNYTLEKDDPSLVFHANEQHEIAALVPRQAKPRTYIPEYLPDLPPDFTFTSTGNYMKTTRDLKEIKLKMAEESRLNEASLYKLIDDDERRWRKTLEQDLEQLVFSDAESVMEEIMSPSGDKAGTDIDVPEDKEAEKNGKKQENDQEEKDDEKVEQDHVSQKVPETAPTGKEFDFVEYARKRHRARQRHSVEMDRRRKLRKENVFLKAETLFSPYASAPPTKDDTAYFANISELAFKKVIKATRVAEQKKQRKLAEIAEARRRRQEEQQEENGAFEFGFAFNPAANISDDSDEEMFETRKELDFGDETGENDGIGRNGEDDGNGENGGILGKSGPNVDSNEISENSDFPDFSMGDSSDRPQSGQVAGKAPLKTLADTQIHESDIEDLSDNDNDIEDELEQHFGLEEDALTSQHNQHYGELDGERDGLFGGDLPSGETHTPVPPPVTKDPSAHVSWGDLGSEESEEDDLEDIE